MEQFFQTQRDGCRNAIPKMMQRFHQSIGLNVEIALIEFIAITTGLMRYMVIVLLDGPARCRFHF